MLDGHWRSNIEKGLRPVGRNIRRTGISADHLTGLGVVMAASAAVAIAAGNLHLGLLLLVLTGIPDALDGAVAKASGSAGPRGAFFDSTADRISDSLLLVGVAAPAGALLTGIDVASHQHPSGAAINWAQVRAAGHSFAFVKEKGLA